MTTNIGRCHIQRPIRKKVSELLPNIKFFDRKNKFGPNQKILKIVHKGVAGVAQKSKAVTDRQFLIVGSFLEAKIN